MAASRGVALAKVPERGGSMVDPSLRGKNSYQDPTRARRRSTRRGHGPLTVTSSRIGYVASTETMRGSVLADSRTGTGRVRVRMVRAAARRSSRDAGGVGMPAAAAARSRRRAPSSNSSSTSIPAGILMPARCCQVPHGSDHASMSKFQSPKASGRTVAVQPSSPSPVGTIRRRTCAVPSDRRSTTWTPRAS